MGIEAGAAAATRIGVTSCSRKPFRQMSCKPATRCRQGHLVWEIDFGEDGPRHRRDRDSVPHPEHAQEPAAGHARAGRQVPRVHRVVLETLPRPSPSGRARSSAFVEDGRVRGSRRRSVRRSPPTRSSSRPGPSCAVWMHAGERSLRGRAQMRQRGPQRFASPAARRAAEDHNPVRRTHDRLLRAAARRRSADAVSFPDRWDGAAPGPRHHVHHAAYPRDHPGFCIGRRCSVVGSRA